MPEGVLEGCVWSGMQGGRIECSSRGGGVGSDDGDGSVCRLRWREWSKDALTRVLIKKNGEMVY